MPVASLEELMEAGVHFGHQTNRWNPKMKSYIWGERNGIYIIDLTQTTQLLDKSYQYIKEAASRGKKIVFVGTKKQAAEIVEEEANRCGAYFINKRWLGGTLTNFETIRTRINKLRELEEMKASGHFDRLPKKEVAVLSRQLAKLNRSLGGIKDMRGMPDVIYVVDQKRELIAVNEANKAGITVIGIADTNADPNLFSWPIPGNDDAIKSVRLITSKLADAILEGRSLREKSAGRGGVVATKADEVSAQDFGAPAAVAEAPAEQQPAEETVADADA